ncbi:MAG: DNA gyrase subunit A [Patescibacteria group bacterium]|nr:DNA gyrase subunit A [Patescibacteria group bacterium]
MAKEKPEKIEKAPGHEIGYIKDRDINAEMQESYLDYAMSVIVARALPDVRDGLKPVHRRILYAMNLLGIRSGAKYRKSALIVGEVLGKYHPHGDLAVYNSMVRMAQTWAMRYQQVDGQGNFGSMDGDSPAAMRYTEARMTKYSEEMLADLDKDTVDFVPNYDGSQKEPIVLPSKLPNLLLNGQMGIAVGMATNIPPHNLAEVVDGTVALIDNPDATVEDIMEYVKGPDFPTGATIYNASEIKQAYATGKGKVMMRAVAEIEEDKKGDQQIIISELPYQVNKADLISKIADLVKEKKIVGVSDIRDESDRKKSVRVVLDLKKDAYANKIMNQLFKLTPMQSSFGVNMIALIDGIQPRVLTLKTILEEFIKHRKVVITRRSEYELNKAKDRAHILEGLIIALDNIDEVIHTIKKSASTDDAKKNLIMKFSLSEPQALAILAMQLRTLAGLERKKIDDEYAELQKLIAYLEDLLAHEEKVLAVIKEELLELKTKYGDERRTKIFAHSLDKFNEEDLIPNEKVIVTLTNGGYIKRILCSTYRSQGRGGKGVTGTSLKEEDVVTQLVPTNNHDNLLLFTNMGRVFQIKVWEVPMASRIAKGTPVINLIQLAPEEKVAVLVALEKFDDNKFLIMCTKQGTIKKTPVSAFANIRKTGIIAIGLDKKDELKWVKETTGKDEIIMATAHSLAIRFKETDVRPMGRSAHGVRAMRLKKDDEVVGMDVVIPKGELLVITEHGYGKRTILDQFALHHRGGVGIKVGVVTSKTGKTVDVRVIVSTADDAIVVSSKGQVIRVPLSTISRIGRATQGVRIMRLEETDSVASVACVNEQAVECEILENC